MKLSIAQARSGGSQLAGEISPRTKVLIFGLFGLGLLILVGVLWFAIARPVKVLPRIRTMPSFGLSDQYSLPLNDSDLRGRQVLINFTYSGCGADCAAQRQRLVDLREWLRAEGRLGREVLFLTVSFDPARDTREALQTYAAQLGADPRSWRMATGTPEVLKQLIGGELGIYYGPPDAAGRIEHEQQVILVDASGMMRARYEVEDLMQTRLSRDLDLLSAEQGSSGMMRQVYEASHIFLCYPPD